MVKKLSIFLFVIILFSCKKENKLEHILSNDSKKWVFHIDKKKIDPGMPLLVYNIYNKNATSTLYYTFADGDTPIKTTKWNYSEKDSILNMWGLDFKVLKFQEDTIFLEYKKFKPLLIKHVEFEKKN